MIGCNDWILSNIYDGSLFTELIFQTGLYLQIDLF